MRRSVLTEKVARRGFHVAREYEFDPLEVLFVREVMRNELVAPAQATEAAHAEETVRTVTLRMAKLGVTTLRVVDTTGNTVGSIVLEDVLVARRRHLEEETRREAIRPLPSWVPLPPWAPLVGPRDGGDARRSP
jgi:CBS-domain-containing membrane protein